MVLQRFSRRTENASGFTLTIPDACKRLIAISISSALEAASGSLLFAQQLRLYEEQQSECGRHVDRLRSHTSTHYAPAIENIGVRQEIGVTDRIALVELDHAGEQVIRAGGRIGVTTLGKAVNDGAVRHHVRLHVRIAPAVKLMHSLKQLFRLFRGTLAPGLGDCV
jgi:hypothetical protein